MNNGWSPPAILIVNYKIRDYDDIFLYHEFLVE